MRISSKEHELHILFENAYVSHVSIYVLLHDSYSDIYDVCAAAS